MFEGFQASPACPSDKSSITTKMNVEHWWNDDDGGDSVTREKPTPLSLCPPQITHALF
jgi:hypothetical protein